jgi:hypothetical protein
MHPSSNLKSPTFQSPHHTRPPHCHHPTRTSHASYVGHQHNIPYNLKGKPSSTHIQPWHDSSNFLLPIGMLSTVTNKFNRNLLPMPKIANAFHMHLTSRTKFSSIVTLEIHIWVNLLSLYKVLMRLSMYNNSKSMVPFSYRDHQLLLSASTFTNWCIFLNVTTDNTNVVPQSLWPTHTSIHDIKQNIQSPLPELMK